MEAFALRGLQFLVCWSSLVSSRLSTENPVRVATQLGNERGVYTLFFKNVWQFGKTNCGLTSDRIYFVLVPLLACRGKKAEYTEFYWLETKKKTFPDRQELIHTNLAQVSFTCGTCIHIYCISPYHWQNCSQAAALDFLDFHWMFCSFIWPDD